MSSDKGGRRGEGAGLVNGGMGEWAMMHAPLRRRTEGEGEIDRSRDARARVGSMHAAKSKARDDDDNNNKGGGGLDARARPATTPSNKKALLGGC